MKTNFTNTDVATVQLPLREVLIINNALNEVCNGIHLEGEFDTRIGCSVDEARRLLGAVSKLLEEMERP
jgi:hypothetical protein